MPPVTSSLSAPRPRPSAATVRRLIGLGRSEVPRLAGGTAFLVIGSLMSLLYPQGVRIVIDDAMEGARRGLIDRTMELFSTPLRGLL